MTQRPCAPPRPPIRAAMQRLGRWATLGTALVAGAACATGPSDRNTTMIDRPGPGTNRIEVTGNSADNVQVHCAEGVAGTAGANVNSVNIDGRALQGRTVVITGRNTRGVHAGADCPASGAGTGGAANINSVNIR